MRIHFVLILIIIKTMKRGDLAQLLQVVMEQEYHQQQYSAEQLADIILGDTEEKREAEKSKIEAKGTALEKLLYNAARQYATTYERIVGTKESLERLDKVEVCTHTRDGICTLIEHSGVICSGKCSVHSQRCYFYLGLRKNIK